jgi:hypothetical protein
MTTLTQVLQAKPTKKNIRTMLKIAKKRQFEMSVYEDIRKRRESAIRKALNENEAFKTQVSNTVDRE